MPLYCSRFMVAPCTRTLGVVPDHSSRVFRRCWRKLWHPVRLYTGSVTSSPDSEFRNSEMLTQSGKPFHTPVMVKEVLKFLDIKPGQVVLDLTFGAGGHSKAILQSVPSVTVVAADRDPTAFQMAQRLAEEYTLWTLTVCGTVCIFLLHIFISAPLLNAVDQHLILDLSDVDRGVRQLGAGEYFRLDLFGGQVKPVLGRFSELNNLLPALGLGPGGVDAALLDAGCSSMQMDSAERGFSLSKDGPLDMRMDGDRYPDMPCAADVVNALDQQALASVLAAYGEERHTRKIAAAIAQARSIYPIGRTLQLASIVAGAFPVSALYARRDRLQRPSHVATKTFQALRIFVNDELNELHAGLRVAQTLLRPKGRLCVLTFHSLEDRLTKRFLRGEDLSAPPRRSLRQRAKARLELEGEEHEEEEENEEEEKGRESKYWVSLKKVIKPSEEEVQENPRARSAKLRTTVKR
ncbi:probable methyltransferase-like protein 15 isoform X1 [Carassius gibelio]|uniref:probable methyltransferase-like protein 15 isoform X1 n=1 Tax=Carassius gibelio TaxID=101364 RepID=UPI002278B00D|nr:probable methyltransferase-like protein 15 isoform X1 [Carassius gibelio]XP_052416726.1 probable methyltransferase-like protein 15 isoform X1 [Carassius gibelio]XP_052416727.1 probable methyltransferase-like protein 15 isoform X1 [Carassius gibelio]